ncbi:hypothetical protein TNCV_831521 [Trichonephila clavipes]|nr:hypothetical protein TNCV_831521 [Trichonephila clavipes]
MATPRAFSLYSGVKPSKIVLSPVWCSKLRLTTFVKILALSHDEFCGTRSDFVRQEEQSFGEGCSRNTPKNPGCWIIVTYRSESTHELVPTVLTVFGGPFLSLETFPVSLILIKTHFRSGTRPHGGISKTTLRFNHRPTATDIHLHDKSTLLPQPQHV